MSLTLKQPASAEKNEKSSSDGDSSLAMNSTCQIGEMIAIEPEGLEKGDPSQQNIVRKLRILNNWLRKEKKTIQGIAETGEDNSLRLIQCNRYELMLRDDSSTYERLRDKFVLPEHHRLTRQELHDFVKHQAIRGDPRLMQHNHNDNHNHNHNDKHNDNDNDDYVFDNFSIIITYGRVGQQVPHIDLISPNFQFGLALSDGVPGTLIYQNTAEYKDNASVIRAVHDMWKANPDISDTLYQALVQNLNERNLLSDFARLLLPFELIKKSRKTKISTGTLLSTPGSVIHAGPGCTSFRAIIFCSAWPSSRRHSHSHSHSHSHTGTARAPVAPYNPDVQATKSILWCKLICCVWETVPLCDRKYLLTELVKMIQKKEHPDLELLILEPKMIRFIVEIKNTRLKRKQFELVSKYAKMDNFCLIGNAVVVVSSSSDDEGSSQQTKRQRRCD